MATPKIEVEIGAVADGLIKNVDGSIKSLQQLEKELDDLDKKLKTAADPTEIVQLNQQIGALKAGMQSLRTAGVQPLSKATREYNSVGTDFARIIQDAPFGVIGVSNNITALADSFSAARAKGQSFTKILGSIFSGGSLVSIGLSALTSAFVVLQQKGFFKTEESAESLSDKLEKYKESLSGVELANLQGAQSAQKEISALKGLELQATNTSLSTKQRGDAVKKLQELYPEYFANLTEEQIKNGDVGEAYKKVTKNLIAKAKAQASVNQIAENSIKIAAIEANLEEVRSKRLLATTDAQAQLDALIEKRQKDGFLTQGDIQRYDELLRRINNANEAQGEEITFLEEKLKLLNTNELLEKNINAQLQTGVSLVDQKNKSLKENITTLEDYTKKWNENEQAILKNLELQRQLAITPQQGFEIAASKLTGKEGDIAFADPVLELQNKIAKDLAELKLPDIKAPEFDQASSNSFFDRVENFKVQASQILETGLEQSIGNFAFALGEALANGGDVFKALGGAILGGIAMVLDQLGQAAIAAGVGMIAIKEAFKNPGTAIAAGIGLIALAGFIKTKVGKATGSIGGGGGGGSFSGASGVSQGTAFTGGGTALQFDRSLNLVGEFRVKGQDLVYVFNQANSRNQRG
jgi:hypothetical protein